MRLNHMNITQKKLKEMHQPTKKSLYKVGHDFRTTKEILTTMPIIFDMSILGVMMGITIDGMMGP